jgi:hypothetical protein
MKKTIFDIKHVLHIAESHKSRECKIVNIAKVINRQKLKINIIIVIIMTGIIKEYVLETIPIFQDIES